MPRIKINEDNYKYIRFVGPQILEKELMALSGLLGGVVADKNVDFKEMKAVQKWLNENAEFADKHPFNEIFFEIESILQSNIWEIERLENIQWLCQKLLNNNSAYFSTSTRDMQTLHGILSGILADGSISREELKYLQEWMQEKDLLKKCWPYDEVETLIIQVLKDGKIDQREQAMLIKFFSEFVFNDPKHKSISLKETDADMAISGLCAVDPCIEFSNNIFCFTGKFKNHSRNQLAAIIGGLGGMFTDSLSKQVNYLIVGSDGNAAWVFSCYGRKVEQAVSYRKQGCNIMIIHENDYWDAVRGYMAKQGLNDAI